MFIISMCLCQSKCYTPLSLYSRLRLTGLGFREGNSFSSSQCLHRPILLHIITAMIQIAVKWHKINLFITNKSVVFMLLYHVFMYYMILCRSGQRMSIKFMNWFMYIIMFRNCLINIRLNDLFLMIDNLFLIDGNWGWNGYYYMGMEVELLDFF